MLAWNLRERHNHSGTAVVDRTPSSTMVLWEARQNKWAALIQLAANVHLEHEEAVSPRTICWILHRIAYNGWHFLHFGSYQYSHIVSICGETHSYSHLRTKWLQQFCLNPHFSLHFMAFSPNKHPQIFRHHPQIMKPPIRSQQTVWAPVIYGVPSGEKLWWIFVFLLIYLTNLCITFFRSKNLIWCYILTQQRAWTGF